MKSLSWILNVWTSRGRFESSSTAATTLQTRGEEPRGSTASRPAGHEPCCSRTSPSSAAARNAGRWRSQSTPCRPLQCSSPHCIAGCSARWGEEGGDQMIPLCQQNGERRPTSSDEALGAARMAENFAAWARACEIKVGWGRGAGLCPAVGHQSGARRGCRLAHHRRRCPAEPLPPAPAPAPPRVRAPTNRGSRSGGGGGGGGGGGLVRARGREAL
eukprot:SAG31_NODE_2370_length_5852_cov_2.750391_8_plen_215_part_01